MRITFLLGWSRLNRQACQEQTVNTAAALARAGAQVTLLAPRGPDDPAMEADAVRTHHRVEGPLRIVQRRFFWPDTGVVPSYLWLNAAMEDDAVLGSDLVVTRIPTALGAHSIRRRRFAFDHYRPWPDQLPWLRGRFRQTLSHPNCAGVVVHSHYAAESYRRLDIPGERVLVAHNGHEPRSMAPALDKAAARAALDLPGDRPIAVYAGRLNQRKGLEQVMLMADRTPEALFILVGSEKDGEIEHEAARRPNVRVTPWQPPEALPAWLYAADVLLIPPSLGPVQRFGTTVLPLKTFKYLAAGRPILAPYAPDMAEILQDERNALLVQPDAPEAAVAALRRLLHEPGLAERLSRNALDLAQVRTWDHRARRMLDFFERRLTAPELMAAE